MKLAYCGLSSVRLLALYISHCFWALAEPKQKATYNPSNGKMSNKKERNGKHRVLFEVVNEQSDTGRCDAFLIYSLTINLSAAKNSNGKNSKPRT